MADSIMDLPAGFEVDAPNAHALPPGFELEQSPNTIKNGADYRAFLKSKMEGPAPVPPILRNAGTQTIDFQNTTRAAAQGTTPNMAAQAKHELGNIEQDEADRFFYKDSGGKLVPFDQSKHVMLQDPESGKLKAFERAEDTREGPLAGLGRFVIAGSGAGGIEAQAGTALRAPRVTPGVASSQRLGADVPRAITTQSPTLRLLGSTVSKAPGGAGLYKDIEESRIGLGQKLDQAVKETGGNPNPAVGGAEYERGIEGTGRILPEGDVQAGVQEGFKPQTKDVLKQLYGRVDAGVDQNMLHPLDNTIDNLATIVAKRQGYNDPNPGSGYSLITNAIKKPGGLTYQAIKDLRTRVGDELDDKRFPEGVSQNEWRGVYGALTDDLRNAVVRSGSPDALQKFDQANTVAKRFFDWKDQIDKVIGARSNEGIIQKLYDMAGTGRGADIETLSAAKKAVPKQVWDHVTANALSRLGRDQAGQFSPQRFFSDYGSLSDAGKRLLFTGESKNLLPFLDDIKNVSNDFVQAGKLGNPSGSGSHFTMGAFTFGLAERAAEGQWKHLMGMLAFGVTNFGIAKVLGNPAGAASAAKLVRSYRAVLNRPGPKTAVTFDMAVRNFSNTTSDIVGIPASEINQRIRQAAQRNDEGGTQPNKTNPQQ